MRAEAGDRKSAEGLICPGHLIKPGRTALRDANDAGMVAGANITNPMPACARKMFALASGEYARKEARFHVPVIRAWPDVDMPRAIRNRKDTVDAPRQHWYNFGVVDIR